MHFSPPEKFLNHRHKRTHNLHHNAGTCITLRLDTQVVDWWWLIIAFIRLPPKPGSVNGFQEAAVALHHFP